ncbi:MAG: PP2C family protein-serine/threonine phosphatase, partial [Gemmobacter sp.]
MIRLRHSATSHVGRVRKLNEDSILVLPEHRLFVVSDGMGGHAAGDFASQTVVECIAALPVPPDPAAGMHALRAAIRQAPAVIRA